MQPSAKSFFASYALLSQHPLWATHTDEHCACCKSCVQAAMQKPVWNAGEAVDTHETMIRRTGAEEEEEALTVTEAEAMIRGKTGEALATALIRMRGVAASVTGPKGTMVGHMPWHNLCTACQQSVRSLSCKCVRLVCQHRKTSPLPIQNVLGLFVKLCALKAAYSLPDSRHMLLGGQVCFDRLEQPQSMPNNLSRYNSMCAAGGFSGARDEGSGRWGRAPSDTPSGEPDIQDHTPGAHAACKSKSAPQITGILMLALFSSRIACVSQASSGLRSLMSEWLVLNYIAVKSLCGPPGKWLGVAHSGCHQLWYVEACTGHCIGHVHLLSRCTEHVQNTMQLLPLSAPFPCQQQGTSLHTVWALIT